MRLQNIETIYVGFPMNFDFIQVNSQGNKSGLAGQIRLENHSAPNFQSSGSDFSVSTVFD